LSRVSDAKEVLVWQNGFEHWRRAADVPELAALVLRPPPLPPRPPPLPSAPPLRALLSEVSAGPAPLVRAKTSSKWGKLGWAVGFVVAFAIVRSIFQSSHSSSQTSQPDPSAKISGTGRQTFVTEGMKTCMQKQENDPETKALSISKDKLTKYC